MLVRYLTLLALGTVLLLSAGQTAARGKQRPAPKARSHGAANTVLMDQLQHADPNNLPAHLRNNPVLRAQMEAMAQLASRNKHKSSFDSADKLQREAAVHAAAGRHAEAVRCRRQAIQVLEVALGRGDDRVLAARVELARAEHGMGNSQQALKSLDEALSVLESKSALDKRGLSAQTLVNAHLLRSDITFDSKDFAASSDSVAKARRHFRAGHMAALEKQAATVGAGIAEATSMYQEDAFQQREDRLLTNEQRLAKLESSSQLRTGQLTALAVSRAAKGVSKEASASVRRAAIASERDVGHLARVGTFGGGLLSGVVALHAMQEALALTLAQRDQRPEDILLAYWLSAGRKDRVFSVDGHAVADMDATKSQHLSELRALRVQHAAQFLEALGSDGRAGASAQERQQEVRELEVRLLYAQALQDVVLSNHPLMFARHDVAALSSTADRTFFDGVRNALDANEVVIEFVRYAPTDFNDVDGLYQLIFPSVKSHAARYAAFVVSKARTEPIFVELGHAEEMEGKIAEFRRLATDPNSALNKVELASAQMYAAVWAPLVPHIPTGAPVIISADARLHWLPFEALFDGKQVAGQRWLLNQHSISYVNNVRELTGTGSRPLRDVVTKGLVLADALAPRKQYSHPALRPDQFQPLPTTRREAKIIATHFGDATTLLQAQANEPELLKVRSPRFLHIASHGVFLTDAERGSSDEDRGTTFRPKASAAPTAQGSPPRLKSALPESSVDPEDHWFRSALVLSPSPADAPFDSFTTAYEVARMDLRGTRMVVLAGCETALGVVNADGARSLKRAFMIAGAHSVVASLWLAEDDGTLNLMQRFYAELAAGQSRVQALREAKLAQQKLNPHPFYWAAFTLSGKDGKL